MRQLRRGAAPSTAGKEFGDAEKGDLTFMEHLLQAGHRAQHASLYRVYMTTVWGRRLVPSYCGDFPGSHGQVGLRLSFLTFAQRTWPSLLSRLLGKERPRSSPCNLVNHFVKKKKKWSDRMALANLPRAVLHEVKLGKSRCHSSLAVSTGSGRSCRSVPARRQMSFEQTGCAACLLWPRLRY